MNLNDKTKKIFEILKRQNPHPTTELVYNSTFELLVAVALSAQSTDISVNKVTAKLFALANTPEKIIKLGIAKIEELTKSIGLYKNKTKNIIALSQILIKKYDGAVPDNFDALVTLPGVGRKTANVILNTVFHHPVIAVDTHVFRVSKRLGITDGDTPLAVENQLYQIIPDKFKHNAHHWLILHGRYICKAKNPKCSECPINKYCDYYKLHFKISNHAYSS